MTLLRVENLRKSFGGLMAVKDLSFHVEKGEILGADWAQRGGQEHRVQSHHGEA
jgi:ABC-type uncharacterized transport system ATPase subunit